MGIMAQKGPKRGHNRVRAFKRTESFRDSGASQGVAKEGEKRREEVTGRKVGRWWEGREGEGDRHRAASPVCRSDSTRE